MTAPRAETTAEALERLINQFADPLAFFRELIQNAIDAGTTEVDIRFSHAGGVMTIEVSDFGEGMDRQVIDTKLTRLFSSGKEDDYTKIGRFGIGFVSVFAIDPDAVVVDTSRGGESWRVLFKKDRTFERIALDTPVDGTRIRVLKSADEEEYEAMRARAPEVVSYWCRHVTPEVRVDGEAINRPLDIESPCKVRYTEEGTEVVVAYSAEETPTNGYYNRGITLHEERAESRVAFKIDSRYLEHTLTRDNVLHDENYEKAMAKVDQLVGEALPDQLFSEIDRRVASLQDHAGTRDQELEQLWELAVYQLRRWKRSSETAWNPLASSRVLSTYGGVALTLEQTVQALRARKLYTTAVASPIAAALTRRGSHVVRCEFDSSVREFLRSLGRAPADADGSFCSPQPLSGPVSAAHGILASSVLDLLRKHGAKTSEVLFGHLAYEGSQVADRVAITQRSFGELTQVEEAHKISAGFLSKDCVVVINADHPTVRSLLSLAPREPEFAAYVATKLLFLRSELTSELDTRLANFALEERWRRSAS